MKKKLLFIFICILFIFTSVSCLEVNEAPSNNDTPNDDKNNTVVVNPYERFKGKKLSIVGDSISTFSNYIVPGYGTCYPTGNLTDVKDTWWMKLVSTTGMTLLRNCSWTATCVSNVRHGYDNNNAIVACSDRRIKDLSDGESNPDIIIVSIGINDFNSNAKIRGFNGTEKPTEAMVKKYAAENNGQFYFDDAYALMLAKIYTMYPEAEVFCTTLLESKNAGFNNSNLVKYNNAIKFVASTFATKVIDLHSCGINQYNWDKYLTDTWHPNILGADRFYRVVLQALVNNSFNSDIDLPIDPIEPEPNPEPKPDPKPDPKPNPDPDPDPVEPTEDNLYHHPMMYKKPGTPEEYPSGFYNLLGVWTNSDGIGTSSIGEIHVEEGATYIIERGSHTSDYWVHYLVDGVWLFQDDSVSASPSKITVPTGKNITTIVIGGYGDIESFRTFKIYKVK